MVKSVTPKYNQLRLNKFGCYGLEGIVPHLEFTVTLQSNNLIPEQRYKKRQDIIYNLIKFLKESEGLGYRRISYKLNSWGIKTERGNIWNNSMVYSILKRRTQRDDRIENQRLIHFNPEMSKLDIKYRSFE